MSWDPHVGWGDGRTHEGCEAHSGPMEARLDGPHLKVEELGDFVIIEVFQLAEHQDLSMCSFQAGERVVDHLSCFTLVGA